VVTKPYPWDEFLEEKDRPRVEGFRHQEWRNIQLELRKLNINLGVEPCWVEPGRAVFWQQQVLVGHEPTGYERTEPQNANNASHIARYLRKGLLLRPPDQEIVEMEDEVLLTESEQTDPYICLRHGNKRKSCPTWKGYIKHLQFYHEAPEYEPPAGIAKKAEQFAYYCVYHDKGFQNIKGAKHHRTSELKRPGKSFHLSLEEMRMSKE